jgi:outer membrane protein, heavy metal efflux system
MGSFALPLQQGSFVWEFSMECCALRTLARNTRAPTRRPCVPPLALFVLACAVGTAAEAAPLPEFRELLRQAESSAPRLVEGAAQVQAAEGLAQQAAAFPNPLLGVQSENFGGDPPFNRFSSAETTVSLSELVEIGGKRRSRIAAGRADLDAAQSNYTQVRADFAHDLAIAYATAEAADTRATLAAEELTRAEEDLRAARALVDAGRESDLRAIQAQAQVAGARADLEMSRADAAEALIRISSLVGIAQPYSGMGPSLLGITPTLEIPTSDPPRTPPMVLVAQAEREAAARRLELERKRAISDLTVSVGKRRLAAADAHAFVAGVSVPLPLFDRNRGTIAARNAELAAAEARLNGAKFEAEANWRSAVAQARAAENRLKASDELESAAREAYRLARLGYDSGRTPLIELLATRRALTDARSRALDARVARIQAEATLARLAGRIPFGE